MPIPNDVAERVLIACGRHCCVCRQFKPTRLQVHHIDLSSEGGGDDYENLIAVCLNCHTDIHSQIPFIRRFTPIELKGHRDRVYQLVADGRLMPDATAENRIRHAVNVSSETAASRHATGFSPEARETLCAAVQSNGHLMIINAMGGFVFQAGRQEWKGLTPRETARRKAAYEKLENADYIRAGQSFGETRAFSVTHAGFLAADDWIADAGQPGPAT